MKFNAPRGDNGGKNVFRHLNREELRLVADYARTHSLKETKVYFSLTDRPVRRACAMFGIKPAPFKFLDLSAIASASHGMSKTDAAAKFSVSRATITKALRLFPKTEDAA